MMIRLWPHRITGRTQVTLVFILKSYLTRKHQGLRAEWSEASLASDPNLDFIPCRTMLLQWRSPGPFCYMRRFGFRAVGRCCIGTLWRSLLSWHFELHTNLGATWVFMIYVAMRTMHRRRAPWKPQGLCFWDAAPSEQYSRWEFHQIGFSFIECFAPGEVAERHRKKVLCFIVSVWSMSTWHI